MATARVEAPGQLRFGKLPPKKDYRTLLLSDYIAMSIGPPPNEYENLARVAANLPKYHLADLFPMDGNDTLGDCTIAALAHASTLWHALLKRHSVAKTSTVTRIYMHLTGGVDSGLYELDVLNYWRKHSAAAEKILAYVAVDPKNHDHI